MTKQSSNSSGTCRIIAVAATAAAMVLVLCGGVSAFAPPILPTTQRYHTGNTVVVGGPLHAKSASSKEEDMELTRKVISEFMDKEGGDDASSAEAEKKETAKAGKDD